MSEDPEWSATRRGVIRDAVAVGVATGAYGLSFGAIAVTTGLSLAHAMALSLLMFTGASQFALVGVLGAAGSPIAAAATAALLGARNALYGLQLTSLLRVRGIRRLAAAQLVIDESTAMAVARETPRAGRVAFWATGISVFAFWNSGTLVGALGARALASPETLGLDAAVPAAFLALLGPRLSSAGLVTTALAAALVALMAAPLVPAGVPVLLAALVAVVVGLSPGRVGDEVAAPLSDGDEPGASPGGEAH